MLLNDGGPDGVQTSAQSRILRVTVRVSAAVVVWAYFVAALVLDARRALPLALCVLALLAYAGALRVRHTITDASAEACSADAAGGLDTAPNALSKADVEHEIVCRKQR